MYQLSKFRITVTACPLECSCSTSTLMFTQWLPSCGNTRTLPLWADEIMTAKRERKGASDKNIFKSSQTVESEKQAEKKSRYSNIPGNVHKCGCCIRMRKTGSSNDGLYNCLSLWEKTPLNASRCCSTWSLFQEIRVLFSAKSCAGTLC